LYLKIQQKLGLRHLFRCEEMLLAHWSDVGSAASWALATMLNPYLDTPETATNPKSGALCAPCV
jgi:hypothetical protein